MKYCICALLWLICLALPARAARAETFKDAQRAFSIELPEGWTPLSASDVDAAAAAVSGEEALHCFAGFQHAQALLLLSSEPYPESATHDYLTPLQIQDLGTTIGGANSRELHSATGPAVHNLGAGVARQVTWITEPPGIVIDSRPARADTRMRTFVFFGRDHILYLRFYMASDDYSLVEESMTQIATSFQFTGRQAINTKTSFKDPNDHVTLGIYLFVSLLILASGLIIRYLLRRKAY